MSLNSLIQLMQPAIEDELVASLSPSGGERFEEFHYMMAYHLGWEGAGAGPEARGKRIRPLMVLLTTAAAGADWRVALPGAAAVELIHNFSLIHDDIEDDSPLRRGRQTLWKLWGIAQAINAGDAMFTLAHLAILRLADNVPIESAYTASRVLLQTCLQLTQGQYLDISYEGRGDLNLDAYWPMVGGKTAALLAASTEIGALAAQVDAKICQAYHRFGWSLGLAFQAQDDQLGIWGDAELTGKSAASDLLTGKKSLPVLYGLSQQGVFAERWHQGPLTADELDWMAEQLELEGGREYTQKVANELTEAALTALEEAQPQGEAGAALGDLALQLLSRHK
jgi:geranylgeranyl diphosphate synthase type I